MSATGRKTVRGALVTVERSLALVTGAALVASCAVAAPANGAVGQTRTNQPVARPATTVTSLRPTGQAYGSVVSGPHQSLPAGQAIAAAVAGVDDALLVHASIRPHTSPAGSPSKWFHAVVRAPAVTSGKDVMALWEAFLVQGAAAEYLSAGGDRADTISGSTIDVELPDGTVVEDVAGGAGDVLAGQQFDAGDRSDAQIAKEVHQILSKYALKPTSVRILHPFGPAPVIVATETAPGSISQHELMSVVADVVGSPVDVDGIYLEIDLPDGQVATRQAYPYRTGAGLNWANPVSGIGIGAPHGGPDNALAPPH